MATDVHSGLPDSARPAGTVTFLFSDIEGSTRRWECNRGAMAAAVARHDALVRAKLEAQRAYVFKTMGDAFCAAFARPREALEAAFDAQRAIAAEDFSAVEGLRVRMALHSGVADERDGDYFGPTVNRVARLLAIGHGGQVLVSGASAELLQGEMPPQWSLRDLGKHRLKDLARSEHVYQLVAPDLPETFPALRSLDQLSNNLPAQLTSFVGRDEVIAEIKALLEHHRLVTLVGTGGAGKTRCAVQVGAELVDGSGDGVWLAELAPISDPSLIASVVAQVLDVQGQPTAPILDTLLAFLKSKSLLLILDNCEHVIGEARDFVAEVLRRCPEVRVLATGRESLNIGGEEVYRMPSLAVPPVSRQATAEETSRYGAVQLFVDRAISIDKRFILSDLNAPHVAEICRRLDGIPLAIELAAARVKVLAPQELAQKLDERLRVLAGGDRSALPRHQTMRALIDWSYDLLSDEERTLFRKLSIFAGGFTLASAKAASGDGTVDEIEMLDRLSSLVDKSLVQAEPADSGTRYRLLESTRQYGREKLNECGEQKATANGHAAAYLALAEELERSWESMPDRAWEAQAEPELENWRAALEWTLSARTDVPTGQRLAATLGRVWTRFALIEGRSWLETALGEVSDLTAPAIKAKLYLAQALLDGNLHLYKASYAAAERALQCYRRARDARGEAMAQRFAGWALLFTGRPAQGEALLQAALNGARTLGVRKLTADVLRDLAVARYIPGDVAGARALFTEALAIFKAVGAQRGAAAVAASLAEAEFRGGDALAAVRVADEAIGAYRALNDMHTFAVVLSNASAYLAALGRYEEASARAREAASLLHDAQDAVQIAYTLQHLAAILAFTDHGDDAKRRLGAHARAALLLGYVDAQLTALEAEREYTEQQEYEKMLAALRQALGKDEVANLTAEGSSWSEDQAVAEALLI